MGKIKVLKKTYGKYERPRGYGMAWTPFYAGRNARQLAIRHAERLQREGYKVAVFKTPAGFNIAGKTTPESLRQLRKRVGEKNILGL